MAGKRTMQDPQVLAAHQFYEDKLIPAMQKITKDKDWGKDLKKCEGIMTCIVVYQAKLMLAGFSWEKPRPGYSTRPMPKMYDKREKFHGIVKGNLVDTSQADQKMSKIRTTRDPAVLAAHQFYLNKLIPTMQEATKSWNLGPYEGMLTCIVVYERKPMLAVYGWDEPTPSYSTRPMPKMYDKTEKFIGTVTGNMLKTGIKHLRDPQFYPLSEEKYQEAVHGGNTPI